MTRRFARLYSDGSMNVDSGEVDLETAKYRLGISMDDSDTEIVEVEIKIVRNHGKPHLHVASERYVTCPTCSEHIAIEQTESEE